MLECPACGQINYLKSEACCKCGAALEEKDKEHARSMWSQGKRFGQELKPKVRRMSHTNSPFAKR